MDVDSTIIEDINTSLKSKSPEEIKILMLESLIQTNTNSTLLFNKEDNKNFCCDINQIQTDSASDKVWGLLNRNKKAKTKQKSNQIKFLKNEINV